MDHIEEQIELRQKIAQILWECKWKQRFTSWRDLATAIEEAIPGDILKLHEETIRKWAKAESVPVYTNLQVIYDHSTVEWVKNLAKDIMVVIRPDLWKE